MLRKIVIIPTFASSHLLKCWIPNMIEVLNPDVIIINEGLFPNGPENKGHIDEDFRKKYCEQTYKKAGFDFQETQQFILNLQTKENPLIVCGILDYQEQDVNEAFLSCISTFPANEHWSTIPKEGDIIFVLEPDAFVYEGDKEIIQEEISKLKPGQGLKCLWRDFLETQYYCEAINEIQPKIRRFCYCFDDMENYKEAMNGFMSQSYPRLKKIESFFIRHYPWFVYDKWKELRYELIYRNDPQYWKDFEKGLQEIRINSENFVHRKWEDSFEDSKFVLRPSIISKKILIRPSRQDEGRWAQFIDIQHPKHIKNHPNFVK